MFIYCIYVPLNLAGPPPRRRQPTLTATCIGYGTTPSRFILVKKVKIVILINITYLHKYEIIFLILINNYLYFVEDG
jgi:hypothetical protein